MSTHSHSSQESIDRRSHRRNQSTLDHQIVVHWRGDSSYGGEGYLEDFSDGGCRIAATRRDATALFPPGRAIDLELDFDDGTVVAPARLLRICDDDERPCGHWAFEFIGPVQAQCMDCSRWFDISLLERPSSEAFCPWCCDGDSG